MDEDQEIYVGDLGTSEQRSGREQGSNEETQSQRRNDSGGDIVVPECLEIPSPVATDELDSRVVEHMTFQTNLYATQAGKTFQPVFTEEMKVFMTINILIRVKETPPYCDYWCYHSQLRCPYIYSLTRLNPTGSTCQL